MQPQYVATQRSCDRGFEALESQGSEIAADIYLLHRFPPILVCGCTQVTLTSYKGQILRVCADLHITRDRRLTCLRASRAFAPFPCLPSWQHVAATTTQVTLKNSWSLTRFQSPSSRSSLVSTTKELSGQATSPVPIRRPLSRRVN